MAGTAGTAGTAGSMPAELAEVSRHVVGLLAQLGRPPRNLRISAGAITVDITWADDVAGGSGPSEGGPDSADMSVAPGDEAATEYLTSPSVGVFFHASAPGAEPFVSAGSSVKPGQQVGIIEAMKLMIPVEADRAGIITAVLKANGEPVEYDEPLFALEPGEASA